MTGAQEENEELINVSDGEEFNKEFQQKARNISNGRSNRVRIEEIGSTPQLAIQAAPPQTQV